MRTMRDSITAQRWQWMSSHRRTANAPRSNRTPSRGCSQQTVNASSAGFHPPSIPRWNHSPPERLFRLSRMTGTPKTVLRFLLRQRRRAGSNVALPAKDPTLHGKAESDADDGYQPENYDAAWIQAVREVHAEQACDG